MFDVGAATMLRSRAVALKKQDYAAPPLWSLDVKSY